MTDQNIPPKNEKKSLFEQAKSNFEGNVANLFGAVGETAVGERVLKNVETLTAPYRDNVAPALSAALMAANSNYQNQNKNLSIPQLFDKAKRDAMASSQDYYNNDPSQAWRRKISPGRAMVALIGSEVPGTQETDKIDWANSKSVEAVFTHGSAQFWSGVGDVGFNSLDPLIFVGKAAKTAKIQSLTRPVTGGKNKISQSFQTSRMEALTKDIDRAAAGQDSPVKPLFDLIGTKDVLSVRRYGPIAESANPGRVSQALVDAYHMPEIGGPQLAAEVLKASIGNEASYHSLSSRYPKITAQLNAVTGRLDAIEKQIKDTRNTIIPTPKKTSTLSKEELDAIEEFNLRAHKDIKELEKEYQQVTKKELKPLAKQEQLFSQKIGATALTPEEATRMATEGGQGTVFGSIASTWSRSDFIETRRVRNAILSSRGFWGEIPYETPLYAGEMAKSLGGSVRGHRVVEWFSPNGKLHETPAGITFVDGIPGEFAQNEADARIRQAIKYGKMSVAEGRMLSKKFSARNSAAERYQFLDRLQEKGFLSVLLKENEKMFVDGSGNMIKLTKQQKTDLVDIVRTLVETTNAKRRTEIKNVIDKNYTVVDKKSGRILVANHIKNLVDEGARRNAEREGRQEVTKYDIRQAEKALTENPALTSQIPNQHFAMDLKEVRNIIRENPGMFSGIIRRVLDGDKNVVNDVRRHGESAATEMPGTAFETAGTFAKSVAVAGYDKTTDALDAFYTFVWKPTTLLSLKYTTRNVFEGWLRVGASMIEMNSQYGYGWSEMARGFSQDRIGGPVRTIENMIERKTAKKSARKFDKINNDILVQDAAINASTGPLTFDGTKIAKIVINDGFKAADKAVFKANDGLSLATAVVKGKFEAINKIANGHAPSAEALAADKVYSEFLSKVYNPKITNEIMPSLMDNDFRTATTRILQADPADAMKTLNDFAKISTEAAKKLESITTKKSGPVISKEIEDLKFFLSRVQIHVDHLQNFLVERENLLATTGEIAGRIKPNLKRAYVKEVELAGGAKLAGSMSGNTGAMMRESTSAHNSSIRTLDKDIQITGAHFLHNGTKREAIDIGNPLWATAHAEYVNNVIMNDAAARRTVALFAAGDDLATVQAKMHAWVKSNEQDAIDWRTQRKVDFYNRNERIPSSWNDEVDVVIEGQVLTNLKPVDAFGDELIIKANNGTLTAVDSANIPRSLRNPVVGDSTLYNAPPVQAMKNIVRSVFHFIGTLPEDHLVRHPFYNMVYNTEANRIAKVLRSQGKDVNKNLAQIRYTASTRAYKELMQRMYSVERYTDMATFMRFVAPFYMAHQNSSRFWLGTSLRNPEVAILLAKGYNAPYRGGFVQDRDGKTVSWGNPWTRSNDTIVMHVDDLPFSVDLRKKIKKKLKDTTGQDFIGFSQASIDVITQGQVPALQTLGGPVGQFAGTAIIGALADKTYDPNSILGKMAMNIDDFQKYIMPYYEKTYGQGLGSQVVGTLNPATANSWIWSVLAAKLHGKGLGKDVEARFQARYEAAYDNLAIEANLNGQSFNDAELQKKATRLAENSLYVEALSSFTGPVVAGKLGNTQYKELNQEWTNLVRENNGNTDAASVELTRRIEQKSNTPFAPAISRVLTTRSASNKYGLWATPETSNNFLKNKALVEKIDIPYPDNSLIGIFFNQGNTASEYSPIIDDNYFSVTVNGKPLRERLTNDSERRRAQQYSQGWETYTNAIEYIEQDAKNHNIKKGSDAYAAYYGVWKKSVEAAVATQYPLWGDRLKEFPQNKSDINLNIIDRFINDKNYMKTVGGNLDTVKAVKAYMDAREVIKQRLDAYRALTGVKSIDAKKNAWFADWRDATVELIAKKHPGFQSIYTRYLQDDTFDNRVDYSTLTQ